MIAPPAGPDLRDIHVPEPSWWPPAPGWWILALLVLLLCVVLVWWSRRRLKTRRKLRALEVELSAIEEQFVRTNDKVALAGSLSQLIRRAILLRGGSAQLRGKAWCEQLQRLAPGRIDEHSVAVLDSAPYRRHADFDVHALMRACRSWLRVVLESNRA